MSCCDPQTLEFGGVSFEDGFDRIVEVLQAFHIQHELVMGLFIFGKEKGHWKVQTGKVPEVLKGGMRKVSKEDWFLIGEDEGHQETHDCTTSFFRLTGRDSATTSSKEGPSPIQRKV